MGECNHAENSDPSGCAECPSSVLLVPAGANAQCKRNTDCGATDICVSGRCESAFNRIYVVTVLRAKVSERTRDGANWDMAGGLPDPYVYVIFPDTNTRPRTIAKTITNTTEPVWNSTWEFMLKDTGQALYFCVADAAPSNPDDFHIAMTGKASCQGSKSALELVRIGHLLWKTDGELKELEVTVQLKQ